MNYHLNFKVFIVWINRSIFIIIIIPNFLQDFEQKTEWYHTNPEPGDIIVFDIKAIHGSFINFENSFRINCDTRWYLNWIYLVNLSYNSLFGIKYPYKDYKKITLIKFLIKKMEITNLRVYQMESKEKEDSLLRMFKCELFTADMLMLYLLKKFQNPGIHSYLVNKLYTLDKIDIKFYMLEICYMVIIK